LAAFCRLGSAGARWREKIEERTEETEEMAGREIIGSPPLVEAGDEWVCAAAVVLRASLSYFSLKEHQSFQL